MNKKLKIAALSLLVPLMMGATYVSIGKLLAVVTSGNTRIESARLALSTTCSITTQNGSWLSTCTRVTTGQYTFTILGGVFSAAPTCSITMGDNNLIIRIRSTTTTLVTFWLPDPGNAMSLTDAGGSDFHIICAGPR